MALSSNNQVKSTKLRKLILVVAVRLGREKCDAERDRFQRLFRTFSVYYLMLVVEPEYVLEKPIRLDKNITHRETGGNAGEKV